MSAYVVDDNCINRIVSTIDRDPHHRMRLGLNGCPENLADLANRLHAMNVRAVRARYQDRHPEMTAGTFQYRYEMPDVDGRGQPTCQAFKSLQCFLYQCAEGDVPECELYRLLEDYKAGVANRIIDQMPEYKAAEWG